MCVRVCAHISCMLTVNLCVSVCLCVRFGLVFVCALAGGGQGDGGDGGDGGCPRKPLEKP